MMGWALTGTAFNPARAHGPMVAASNYSDAWLYLTAPMVGAIAAAIVHVGLARLAQERTVMSEPGPSPGRLPNEFL
jgi:glycerol uptake facilitator-like aquaporin